MTGIPSYTMAAFYLFTPLDEQAVSRLMVELQRFGDEHQIKGLILVGPEGINGTAAVPTEHLERFKTFVKGELGGADLDFKESPGTPSAFSELKIKLKPEIVTLGKPDLVPRGSHGHIGPKEWNQKLRDGDVCLLDVRNDYEVRIGRFEGAVDLGLSEFREFPDRLREAGLDKSKTTLIYCTGGIRCEKALLEMKEQGFSDVYQLDGGILKYLETYGEKGLFNGECFVFDYRVAVQSDLSPSQTYRLCPHCGEPASSKISCVQCKTQAVICENCLNRSLDLNTCSKNCAHHHRMGHRSRRVHLDGLRGT